MVNKFETTGLKAVMLQELGGGQKPFSLEGTGVTEVSSLNSENNIQPVATPTISGPGPGGLS